MLFVGALALSGCPDPETLGTPRTIPRGQIAHTVALTAIGSRDNGAFGGTSAFSPSLPTYMFRLGLADRLVGRALDFVCRCTHRNSPLHAVKLRQDKSKGH